MSLSSCRNCRRRLPVLSKPRPSSLGPADAAFRHDHHHVAFTALPAESFVAAAPPAVSFVDSAPVSTLALPLRIPVLRQRCSAVLGSPPITAKAAASISPPQASGRHPLLSSDTQSEVLFLHEIHICRVTEFEELADVGKRTVELQKTSNNISRIIDANWNEHMKTYVEAGFEPVCNRITHSCVLGLRDNLKNAEALLNELDCLKEDAIAVTEASTKSATALDDSFCEEMLKDISFEEEKEPLPKHPQDTSISEVMLMKIISDMLKLDYAMQKNIILNLNIGTSVSELEGYCLLWNLHPYIDDDIIHREWQYVPSHDHSSRK
ncbi:hypothetical protein ZIOFF_034307 [Zingiber officinale]|uniref:DUF7795 domain-containing protein n=1 Tax=Zingiber officinale TaxID=94328 RepID=A0A8J5L8A2_ZINOF|nr:hypothetical protein ZIOFF_034307 [Zingiber officinale]